MMTSEGETSWLRQKDVISTSCARWVVRTPEYYYYDRPQTLEIQIQQWHGKIFFLWYTKKRKDATDVWLEEGVGAGRGGDGEWLSADVKAGNAGF